MSYILHLETSTKVCSVALSKSGECVNHFTENNGAYQHNERLNVLIETVLEESNVSFQDLAAISISSGPGSYTGLRIGVSTAKGLCYALSIPLIEVNTLTSLAYYYKFEHKTIDPNSILICQIDARRMEVYTSYFDQFMYPIKDQTADIIDVDYFNFFDNSYKLIFIGDGQFKFESLFESKPNMHFSHLEADARGQIELSYEHFLKKQFVDLVYFEPNYLKSFQAGPKKTAVQD